MLIIDLLFIVIVHSRIEVNNQYPIINSQFILMDPAEQLQRLYLAGFEFQTFERFPNSVGVIRGDCIVLMMPTPQGLQMIGTPGWRLGEVIGVLTEINGQRVFQNKGQLVEATPERLEELERFQSDLKAALAPVA